MPDYLANLGFIGYSTASLAFLLLTVLLSTSWRGRLQGGLLVMITLVCSLWALASALQAGFRLVPGYLIWFLEVLRIALILVFFIRLLELQAEGKVHRRRWLRRARLTITGVCVLLLPWEAWLPPPQRLPDPRLIAQILLTVAGLALVEQVYRNTPWEHRWGIKYLCLGLGTVLTFDFYLFSDAVLFNALDEDIWKARGVVNVIAVPLIGISAARNPQWSLDLFVSRKVVFHTTAIFATGVYLLVMALAGYYIRILGGQWSRVLEAAFFAGAAVILVVLLFSGQIRARFKVFISKHFFSYKYDYRDEWLRLIGILSGRDALEAPLPERVIYALGEIVDSPGGILWLISESGQCVLRAQWNPPLDIPEGDPEATSLVRYIEDTEWVINLEEYAADPQFYEGLDLPAWMVRQERVWLVVPLFHKVALLGFVLLARPRAPQQLDWETLDLLKTAGRQAASYLALEEAANALAEARQFEGFNRLSAFVMHDLKNLIAQLSLVVRNAERHKSNPDFIDDAILTISNSVEKMSRLMAQLRSAVPERRPDRIELRALIRQLVDDHSRQRPRPEVTQLPRDATMVYADRDRLGSVIGHVIQNAQDACPPDGRVALRVSVVPGHVLVEVEDNGSGMDRDFVEHRLFKPFDSTKGLTGMGVGAYECRELINSLGGRVEVRSEPGQGTRFSMYLPLPPDNLASEVEH
jgi:putative PEP-CTERM system histidine kinase